MDAWTSSIVFITSRWKMHFSVFCSQATFLHIISMFDQRLYIFMVGMNLLHHKCFFFSLSFYTFYFFLSFLGPFYYNIFTSPFCSLCIFTLSFVCLVHSVCISNLSSLLARIFVIPYIPKCFVDSQSTDTPPIIRQLMDRHLF